MARREIDLMQVVDDVTSGIFGLMLGSRAGMAVSTTVFVFGGALLWNSIDPIDSHLSQSPTIIPTPSCLMDGRPTPSERTYSAKSPDGSSVSVLSSATIFDTKTCPPSSR